MGSSLCPMSASTIRPTTNLDCHLLSRQGAGERCDEQFGGVRVVLGVLGIFDPEDVAGELQNDVLEPATGTQEGDILGPGEGDRRQGPLQAAVGAPRCDEEPVEASERGLPRSRECRR